MRRWIAVSLALVPLATGQARAEVAEIAIAQQFGVSFLPLMVMEHEKLVEKHAKAQGLAEPKVTWAKVAGPSVMNDMMLSGTLHFASTGVPSLGLLWDRTKGNVGVKGVAAMCAYPLYLNARSTTIKGLKDFTEKDRIAVPSVKISTQAILLQMEAEKVFGQGQHAKIDHLTVSLSHPDGLASIMNDNSEVTGHFTSSPFHEKEMKNPKIRNVLNSYDILGGQATAVVVTTTEKFRNANPKSYVAVAAALNEAMASINRNKKAAAALYLQLANDKSMTVDEVHAMIAAPGFEYTATPQKVEKTVQFMHRLGSIKSDPGSWKNLFFAEIHNLPGD